MNARKPRTRVYIAMSLDGFIAGEHDDLSWLPAGPEDLQGSVSPEAVEFDGFLSEVGAILMGRKTYDQASAFEGPWPYGEIPVLVPTHRELSSPHPTVGAVSGGIGELVAAAHEAASGKDLYIDGGNLIRQAIDADLVDHLIITMVPVILGKGTPLFAGLSRRQKPIIEGHHDYHGMVQIHAHFAS